MFAFESTALNHQNEHSDHNKTNLNRFFHSTLSKHLPQWFLTGEKAMLQIFSVVNVYSSKILSSINYQMCHDANSLPLASFVLKCNFNGIHSSDKLKPFELVYIEELIDSQMLLMKFFPKMVLHFKHTKSI